MIKIILYFNVRSKMNKVNVQDLDIRYVYECYIMITIRYVRIQRINLKCSINFLK